jgi:osmotically-inducible protein OsmY
LDDTTIQDAATKRLTDDPGLASVTVIVIGGKATLTGTVNSADLKSAAERVVRRVQGVKSVENKVEISGQ